MTASGEHISEATVRRRVAIASIASFSVAVMLETYEVEPAIIGLSLQAVALFGAGTLGYYHGTARFVPKALAVFLLMVVLLELLASLIRAVPKDDYPISPLSMVLASPIVCAAVGLGVAIRKFTRRRMGAPE